MAASVAPNIALHVHCGIAMGNADSISAWPSSVSLYPPFSLIYCNEEASWLLKWNEDECHVKKEKEISQSVIQFSDKSISAHLADKNEQTFWRTV